MRRKRRDAKMDNHTSQHQIPTTEENYYKIAYYDYFKSAFENTVVNNTESKKLVVTDENIDSLSFMESFDAPPLSEVRASLTSSGNYTQEQVEEIVAGLSTLPEYN